MSPNENLKSKTCLPPAQAELRFWKTVQENNDPERLGNSKSQVRLLYGKILLFAKYKMKLLKKKGSVSACKCVRGKWLFRTFAQCSQQKGQNYCQICRDYGGLRTPFCCPPCRSKSGIFGQQYHLVQIRLIPRAIGDLSYSPVREVRIHPLGLHQFSSCKHQLSNFIHPNDKISVGLLIKSILLCCVQDQVLIKFLNKINGNLMNSEWIGIWIPCFKAAVY